jgi:hypothetical protein
MAQLLEVTSYGRRGITVCCILATDATCFVVVLLVTAIMKAPYLGLFLWGILKMHPRIVNMHANILNVHPSIVNVHRNIANAHGNIVNAHCNILNAHRSIVKCIRES